MSAASKARSPCGRPRARACSNSWTADASRPAASARRAVKRWGSGVLGAAASHCTSDCEASSRRPSARAFRAAGASGGSLLLAATRYSAKPPRRPRPRQHRSSPPGWEDLYAASYAPASNPAAVETGPDSLTTIDRTTLQQAGAPARLPVASFCVCKTAASRKAPIVAAAKARGEERFPEKDVAMRGKLVLRPTRVSSKIDCHFRRRGALDVASDSRHHNTKSPVGVRLARGGLGFIESLGPAWWCEPVPGFSLGVFLTGLLVDSLPGSSGGWKLVRSGYAMVASICVALCLDVAGQVPSAHLRSRRARSSSG